MAIIEAVIEAEFNISVSVVPTVEKNFNRPESDLRQWETVAVIPDDAPVYEGHPTAVPLWVRTKPVLTLDGSADLGNRPEPSELEIDADALWLPYENHWDSITGTWRAWTQGGELATSFSWEQPDLEEQPLFEEISYRVGREIISVPQVRFSGEQRMFSNIAEGTYQGVNFTISFVAMLNAPVDGPYAILDWGTPSGGAMHETRPYLVALDQLHYGWGGARGSVDPLAPLAGLRPVFITMVVSPPTVTVYVSTGPQNTFSTSAPAADGVGLSGTPLSFILGGSTDPAWENGDLSIFAVALWGRDLTAAEVTTLNSKYASVWGAASERS